MFSASKTKQVAASGGITKSLRFRSSASASLARTPSSNGSSTKSTMSFWTKRGTLASNLNLYDDSVGSGTIFNMFFNTSDQLQIYVNGSGTGLTTTQVFRDVSSWYHIVVAIDTTQATASNRILIYINGVVVTAFTGTATYYGLNANVLINSTTDNYRICRAYDGYLAALYWIDGQALAPTSFGATDATTGVWQPKAYTGTYGTNGFYLTFANATSTTALGYDTSGNSNNLTVTSISLSTGSTYDSMNDYPVLTSAIASNYAVLNPNATGTAALSNGNLYASRTSGVGPGSGTTLATVGVSSGKWYWEIYIVNNGGSSGSLGIGIVPSNYAYTTGWVGDSTASTGYYGNGAFYGNTAGSTTPPTYTTGDTIGIALDMNALTVAFYKNNSITSTITGVTGNIVMPAICIYDAVSAVLSANFGQQPFTYTPPSGFVALNTYNLPTPTIVQGNKYMDATTYTGNSSTQNIVNAGGFKPDLVWIKSRSGAFDNNLFDSVRSSGYVLCSNNTSGESNYSAYFTGINSNGFSLASSTLMNSSSYTYVGWQWQAGQGSGSSNTNGSITSTVSASTTAGFSVVTYTGTGANATIGHGLGVAPSMIIVKGKTGTSSVDHWDVYHSSIGATQVLWLESSSAAITTSYSWNNTAPTSSVFTVGSGAQVNGTSTTYVAYCFAPISGFSAFGSYTGNGSATGPFVYCGFKPRYVMVKCVTAVAGTTGDGWHIEDTARNTYNSLAYDLLASSNLDEASIGTNNYYINFLSNGFQIATSNGYINNSGTQFIYMAFASNPFKYANAQ